MKNFLVAVISSTTALVACGPGSAPITPPIDVPLAQVTSPAPGLQLKSSINHSRVTSGMSVAFRVDIKNEGTAAVQLPGAGPCNPDLVPVIWDAAGQVVWAEPQRMCAQIVTPTTSLPPGSSLSANRCFILVTGSSPPTSSSCSGVALKPGTYMVGGTFYGNTLPQLQFSML